LGTGDAFDRRLELFRGPRRGHGHHGESVALECVTNVRSLAPLGRWLITCGGASAAVHDDLELVARAYLRREARDEYAGQERIAGDGGEADVEEFRTRRRH